MNAPNFSPSNVFFIKLGRGGEWESDAITKSNTLRFSFKEVPDDICARGDEDEIAKWFLERGKTSGTAKRHAREIIRFHHSPEDTLWITFFDQCLWWTFAKVDPVRVDDETRSWKRSCIGKWSNRDLKGNLLSFDVLSGSILSTAGFRSTVCEPAEAARIISRIRGEVSEELNEAHESLSRLRESIRKAVQQISWGDFELLVDLLISRAGFIRVNATGGTQKDYDIVCRVPITGEMLFIQVKSAHSSAEISRLCNTFHSSGLSGRYLLFCHSINGKIQLETLPETTQVYTDADIARLVVEHGFTDWVLEKAR